MPVFGNSDAKQIPALPAILGGQLPAGETGEQRPFHIFVGKDKQMGLGGGGLYGKAVDFFHGDGAAAD